MLKDVIDFVMSRAGIADRAQALREINFAWVDLWNSSDLPNSVFELTAKPEDSTAIISLPWYVGTIRGVRLSASKVRVHVFDQRPFYQDNKFYQNTLEWKILGVSPTRSHVINATTLDLSIDIAEAEEFHVYLKGATDSASDDLEIVTFQPGDVTKATVKRMTQFTSITKDLITKSDVAIVGANEEDLGIIANCEYEARNQVIQITDKCVIESNFCRCFDILYKRPAPLLIHEYTSTPYDSVLMTKTMEWITLPKEGQEEKAALYGIKSASLQTNFNNDKGSIEKKLDLPTNRYCSSYNGYL
jgi:hypothetical protein